MTDQEFEKKFEDGSLDPELFDHEAHIRLAWIHITKYGIEEAIKNICSQLLNFVNRLDIKDKYNETLTIAATKAVYHFILKSNSDNFKAFITEFPRLKTRFRDLMNNHYSNNIYFSEKAKKMYIEPDLLPFD